MKMYRSLLVAVLFTLIYSAGNAQTKARWKEMDEFHTVMSTTFHPAEENNLQPLKEKAGDLVAKSTAWKAAPVPEGYIPEATKDVLKRLVKECKDIQKAVKKGKPDAELKEMITEAHEVFHEIMEKCRQGDDHKH